MQKSKTKNQNCGVVALATTLLLGAVLTEIALSGIFVVYVLHTSSFGARLSAGALTAAQSGIDDVLLKLIRDKEYRASYTLNVVSNTDAVIDFPLPVSSCGSLTTPQQVIVTSLGRSGLQRRKLQATVVVSCGTGEVRLVSMQEVAAS